MSWVVLRLLFAVLVLESLGSFFLKRWTQTGLLPHIIAGVIFYMGSTTVWAFTLKYMDLGRAVLFYAVSSAVLFLFIGAIGYGEVLTHGQLLGAILGIGCLILIS